MREGLRDLVTYIGDIFGSPSMLPLGQAIARKKRHVRIIYAIVSMLGRSRAGNAALVAWTVLTYSKARRPEQGAPIFQLSISDNNRRCLERVNAVLRQEGIDGVCFNGRPIGFAERLRVLLSGDIWSAGKLLAAEGSDNPFIHIQQALGAASYLLFSRVIPGAAPRLVCVANDHTPVCVALVEAARRNGIAVAYVQHAPVSDSFPPLSYDISVLFDQWSAETYEAAARNKGVATTGKVLILPPFAESYRRPAPPPQPVVVGVCLSFIFAHDRLRQLLMQLSANAGVERIILRPHPRCRANLAGLCRIPKVSVQPAEWTSAEFFRNVHLVLVSNSGVTVEALHHGKPTLFASGLDMGKDDYYGFVREGIVPPYEPALVDHPEKIAEFFDDAWERRYAKLDATVNAGLEELKGEVAAAFRTVLAGRRVTG